VRHALLTEATPKSGWTHVKAACDRFDGRISSRERLAYECPDALEQRQVGHHWYSQIA
jgi:hypothetical protein